MRFTQHYSGSTVCAPSRSCLITGQHTGHTDVRGNAKAAMKDETVSIGEIMKQAGYSTGAFGNGELENWARKENQTCKALMNLWGILIKEGLTGTIRITLLKMEKKIFLPGNDG